MWNRFYSAVYVTVIRKELCNSCNTCVNKEVKSWKFVEGNHEKEWAGSLK